MKMYEGEELLGGYVVMFTSTATPHPTPQQGKRPHAHFMGPGFDLEVALCSRYLLSQSQETLVH